MVRVMLKGVHVNRKTLASGKRVEYHYAWRGGPRLHGKPGSPEYMECYHAAISARTRPHTDTLAGLVESYRSSPEYDDLRASTRREYDRICKRIVADLGTMPTIALEAKGVRAVLKDWRATMADRPRKADAHWSVLKRVLSWAMDQEIISRNPALGGGRLYRGSRRDIIWTDAQIELFLSVAPDNLRLAMLLALWTGQRQADLLRLSWADYDGTRIKLEQEKTGKRVSILVADELKRALDVAPRLSPLVLLNSNGKPWASRFGFKKAWSRVCERAGIEGVTFHDLRGTAVVRLARDGASALQIADITGHSIRSVETILERHYLATGSGVGDAAIIRLNEARR